VISEEIGVFDDLDGRESNSERYLNWGNGRHKVGSSFHQKEARRVVRGGRICEEMGYLRRGAIRKGRIRKVLIGGGNCTAKTILLGVSEII